MEEFNKRQVDKTGVVSKEFEIGESDMLDILYFNPNSDNEIEFYFNEGKLECDVSDSYCGFIATKPQAQALSKFIADYYEGK